MTEGRPKKARIPFEPGHLSYLCNDNVPSMIVLTRLAEQAPESFSHSQEEDEILTNGLDALLAQSKEQLAVLQERSRLLDQLVKTEFGIADPDKWLAEQAESRAKDAKPITLTIPSDVKAGAKASGTSSVAPTTLRIKLVDPKQAGGKNAAGATAPPAVGRGAGSKNLSRMNRPQDEASKAKAATQIPINVFWNQVEAYFKPIEDGDMKFLCDPSRIIDPSPFIVPPLGKPFQEQWQQQYGYVSNANAKSSVAWTHAGDQYKPTLKERLLSLLVDEGLPESQPMNIDEPLEEQSMAEEPSFEQVPTPSTAYTHLDERLRQDLAASGFDEFANCAVDYQEDDAICTELRSLQRQLQEQVAVNYYRKRKLSDIAKTKLAAQEFYSLLGDLDKQLEQVYLKRNKSGKKKKKSSSSSANNPEAAAVVPPETVRLLENRAKLLSAFAAYIPKRHDFLASEEAPLISPEEEVHVIELAKQTGSWLPLPGSLENISTEFSRPMPQTQPVFPK